MLLITVVLKYGAMPLIVLVLSLFWLYLVLQTLL
jgi:hypothetical protein